MRAKRWLPMRNLQAYERSPVGTVMLCRLVERDEVMIMADAALAFSIRTLIGTAEEGLRLDADDPVIIYAKAFLAKMQGLVGESES